MGSAVPSGAFPSGNVADNAEKLFFNNGAQNRFTNQLHVLEVPLGFEYALFKKVPLRIEHGISLSRVLASRVLQYDQASNAYFENNSALHKTGINLFTSVNYTLLKTRTVTLQAGPQVQYDLQSLYKTGPARHLLSGGVGVYMGF